MLLLEALWFFLPALIANQCPGFAARLNLPAAHIPVSRKLLGENKTIGAYYAAPLGALGTIYVQRAMTSVSSRMELFDYQRSDLLFIGILFGLGAVMGDHVKSFFKRRRGIAIGKPWWPFDQLDFVIGGMLATVPIIGWIGWNRIIMLAAFVLFLYHPLGNRLGYLVGIHKTP